MCGISGHIASHQGFRHPQPNVLRHRGPDHTGTWTGAWGELSISFIHNRLSILDLSEAANQPMWSPDKRKVLIFNGEIYNYRELKEKYLQDIQLLTHSDTEVLLHLLIRLGKKGLDDLNGDYAFAFLDLDQAKCWLYRDRVGVKPLYYRVQGPDLCFGSEIKAILAMGVEAKLNREELAAYFAFKFVPGQETLFAGIKRLPPAHYLEYDLYTREIRIECYWKVPDQTVEKASFNEQSHALQALLYDASSIRLLSDVPVGIMLSGGIDSSIIAHAIKDQAKVVHYCASKSSHDLRAEGTSPDFYYASRLSRDWGLTLKEIPLDESLLSDDMLARVVEYGDDLIADGSQIPAYLIARSASKEHKVLLSGMGADELFCGYHWHQLAWLDMHSNRLPLFILKPLRRSMASLDQGRGFFKAYRRHLHKWGKYASYPHYRYGLFGMVGDFETAVSLFPSGKEALLGKIAQAFPENENPLVSLFHFDLNHFLVKNLHYSDRMSMANGLETRVPFLDHRIVSLAAAMPPSFKLSHWGQSKHILRQSYKGKIPEYIFNRRKAGFGMPLRSIFRQPAITQGYIDTDWWKELGIIDFQAFMLAVDKHERGKEDNAALIFSLILFQHWMKRWIP